MMIPCVAQDGQYLVADILPPGAVEVPERPSPDHEWVDDAWVDTGASKKALERDAPSGASATAQYRIALSRGW